LQFFSSLTALTRSEYLALFPLLLVALFILKWKRNEKRDLIRNSVFSLALFFAVISPWTIRNYMLFDKFVPIVSHPWHEIWRGNNSMATGSEIAEHGKKMWVREYTFPDIITKLDSIKHDEKFEIESDKVFRKEAIDFIGDNPGKYIELAFKRALHLWTLDLQSPRVDWKYILSALPLLICLYLSIYILIRKRKVIDWIPLLIFALYQTAVIALVNFELRYQVYFLQTLVPLSGFIFYRNDETLNQK
jgi:4-amino-4-deoxy-L-arabinose transferase-like glycosyltransferase